MPKNIKKPVVTDHPRWDELHRVAKHRLKLFADGQVDLGFEGEPDIYNITNQKLLTVALDTVAFALGRHYSVFHQLCMDIMTYVLRNMENEDVEKDA